MNRIALVCGGTGGHVFPAISVAEEMSGRGSKSAILYVCGKRDMDRTLLQWVPRARCYPIESAPFRGFGSILSPFFVVKLLAGFFSAVSIFLRERPDLVVGFGGYVSVPAILAARFLGKKVLIHEQNVIPGVANKFLARLADGVAVSFPETQRYLAPHRRLRVTGNPIRVAIEKDRREEALRFFAFEDKKITLLVSGGSQGAQSINTNFLGAIELLKTSLRESLQVLHLCGRMPAELAEEAYRRMGIQAKVYSFFDRMELAYSMADFAVGRAGATFLAEIKSKGIPAILVPYPFGSGHQSENAKAFSRTGCAVVLEQEELNAEKLSLLIEDFMRGHRRTRAVDHPEGSSSGNPENPRVLLADFMDELLLSR